MITPEQSRMARAALNLSGGDFAKMAGVGINTVSRFEQGADTRTSSVEAMARALEAKGVVFLGANDVSLAGGVGVRLPIARQSTDTQGQG
ncbi:helix-turn-helix domain-containing protein [Sphingomonas sp. 10B4]|uniref:helix-turn-helix domain-containing protein n=2 Tax=Sphingomonas sp. 10B4 TaxID=3048575 RepID=UPI002AB415D5|nr:helix-turn-helix domain-containing protein [Sphingomonas sp. 10B4]MDY7525863.1 helix-turn-helix domain-containing protein [Sphingomonas sp. 10B4]MEB0284397.1 helix-turn-helix domain-containing protein [Sphingomonas sp. 10B4]